MQASAWAAVIRVVATLADRFNAIISAAPRRLRGGRWCRPPLRNIVEMKAPAGPRLNGDVFYTFREAQIIIESWWRHYNAIRPHASLGYKPPAPEVFMPVFIAWPAPLR